MKKTLNIFWFRRDLRLEDNHGLFKALLQSEQVKPIFIFDKNILENLEREDARVTFIFNQLQALNTKLNKRQKSISIYYGNPLKVFQKLTNEYTIEKVYSNRDYEPYAKKRDKEIYDFLKSLHIEFKGYKDHVIFEKNEIVKNDGNPYLVYTPYSKKWINLFQQQTTERYPSEKLLDKFISTTEKESLKINDIGFQKSAIEIPTYQLSSDLIDKYEDNRNYPALNATSKLGIHLRFGCISIREIVLKSISHQNLTLLKELIWREFFIQILWHFPNTITKAFKPKYDRIKWRNNEVEFEKWCNGFTGYPIVDAGMRELNKTGVMHNRVRMITASFLTKHLLIDWRWGEAYFAKKLLDFELASNIGNWQWSAGCGVDAAPYFRIFNPITQQQKFDSEFIYTKKWVPELNTLDYATAIVDHKTARERCINAYKLALN